MDGLSPSLLMFLLGLPRTEIKQQPDPRKKLQTTLPVSREGNSSRKTGEQWVFSALTPAAIQVCRKCGLRATLTCAKCWDLYVAGMRLRELQTALWRPSSPPLAEKFKSDFFQSLCWPSEGVKNSNFCFLGALKSYISRRQQLDYIDPIISIHLHWCAGEA